MRDLRERPGAPSGWVSVCWLPGDGGGDAELVGCSNARTDTFSDDLFYIWRQTQAVGLLMKT
jgi:hypothetical protein